MKAKIPILKNNAGITLAETLMAFLIVSIAITMLCSCVILAINTISKGRESTKITQDSIKEFWSDAEPAKTDEIQFTFKDNKGKGGTIAVDVKKYEINDIKIYEFINPTETENTENFDGD